MPESYLPPGAFLAKILAKKEKISDLFLLTGERGIGKTAWCLELFDRAQAAGLHPVGLISVAVFQAGVKIGIDLVNLTSVERRRLAVKRIEPAEPSEGCSASLNWVMDPKVLAWGNQVLQHLPSSELLILDELGPLEFEYDEGLTEGLPIIDRRIYPQACVVVRPELLEVALKRWHWGQVIWVTGQAAEADRS